MQTVLEISHLVKTIDDFQFGPIDLTFELGTIHALIGENGAGKSTFIKLLMELIRKEDGQIRLFGKPIAAYGESWKQKIAYQPQTLIGCSPFTGLELMELMAHCYPTWNETYCKQLINMFELPLNKPLGKLSQGVQQKLANVLTLACDTEIVILDEPTAHIDIPAKQMLINVIAEWMERGDKLMIIASHQIEDIRKLADFLIVLKKGKLLGKYEKEELTSQYKQYFLQKPLPNQPIPGEVDRKGGRIVISDQQDKTETYLTKNGFNWVQKESLGLEEVISILLKNER